MSVDMSELMYTLFTETGPVMIDLVSHEGADEADLFFTLARIFCCGIALGPEDDLQENMLNVGIKMRRCGVRCETALSKTDAFCAFASMRFMAPGLDVPVNFPIVRDGPEGLIRSYFPNDRPGVYTPTTCKYFLLGAHSSRFFIPATMSDGSVYSGDTGCDISFQDSRCTVSLGPGPPIEVFAPTTSIAPYSVFSPASYPVIVCSCGRDLQSSFVCVYKDSEMHKVRFVPEINIGLTSGTRRRCPGPRPAW